MPGLLPVAGSVHNFGVRRIASDEQEVQILWSMLNSSDSEGVEDEDDEDEPPPQEVEVEVEVSEAAPATAVLDDAPPQVRASPPLHAPAPRAARRKRSLVMETSDDDSDSDAGGGVRAGADTASSSGSSTDNTVLTTAEPPIVTRQVTPLGRAPANVAPHAPQRPYSLSSQLGATAESPIVLD